MLATCGGPQSIAPAPAPRPRLVVLIVIDQLPTWAFERDAHLFTGGFARLLHEGAYVPAAELPYANTFTAAGHATIATGAVPAINGIVGNSWWRRGDGHDRPAEYDPANAMFAVGPADGGDLAEESGVSGVALRVDGVADALRGATGGRAHAIALALKPRAAVLMAGRHPELAVWYERAAGGMTTSHAYASEAPPWLVALAKEHPSKRFIGQRWTPLDPSVLPRAAGIADDAPGEGALHGIGTAFPHEVHDAEELVHTPFADTIVLDAAYASIDALQLGADDVPDLLAVSLEARDYAGHNWGPDSWEVLDLTLRLDIALGELLGRLDQRFGRDGYAVVLTSDHGATPLVERSPYKGARRIDPKEIAKVAEDALVHRFGDGPWIAKVTASQIYMTEKLATLAAADRDEALDVASTAVARVPQIAAAGRTDHAAGHCETRRDLAQAICNMIVPGASGELYVLPAQGSLITDYKTGTHHDAPFDDNRHVPILVKAPGLAPQRATGSLLQVAPTVAALLGVPAPPAATAPPLFGIHARH